MTDEAKLFRKTRQEREIEVNGETLREEREATHTESENGQVREEIVLTRSIGKRTISSVITKDSGNIVESIVNTNLDDQSQIDAFEADWTKLWKPRLENFPVGPMHKFIGMDRVQEALENRPGVVPSLKIEELSDADPESKSSSNKENK